MICMREKVPKPILKIQIQSIAEPYFRHRLRNAVCVSVRNYLYKFPSFFFVLIRHLMILRAVIPALGFLQNRENCVGGRLCVDYVQIDVDVRGSTDLCSYTDILYEDQY